ncbi:MAG: Mrp/NBP35 family ATP-binding protein [Clostridia bacterium]|nr:Mrp/NBP35 family ATP-binding protein [Clostridia bacterium]MBR5714057.1 Mrp/NBP35 family ATP-binding protein [Clostridia bacterium]MBR5717531.1 Mrp/NBP35 family ATP-binding protein [Clostridia bacterium]
MSENCTHDCSTCGENCASRDPKSLLEKPHQMSSIKKVIAVVSGKGGVGKSLVTALMATIMQRAGFKTAVLDADITGPSIPKLFGVNGQSAEADGFGVYPVRSKTGIDLMSINLLLENPSDPVVWRGPVIAGTVKQFWTEVIWENEDIMFIDMPPGTGDVPLTVFQSIPVDGIIVVTSPQELVSMIVEKAVKMAGMMNIPVLGIVENMSYFECPDCHKQHKIYGESHVDDIAKEYGIANVAKLPINSKLAAASDAGLIELFEGNWLDKLAESICGEEVKNG